KQLVAVFSERPSRRTGFISSKLKAQMLKQKQISSLREGLLRRSRNNPTRQPVVNYQNVPKKPVVNY
ncbi:MAG: hypothetical protein Q7J19_05445, partial [Lutibacter sp.]|nr:hypothetical protein [Lutibacter sp.]